MWSALALLTASSGQVPPFELAAICFAIGGGIGAVSWVVRPGAVRALRQPPEVWALGIGGLFGSIVLVAGRANLGFAEADTPGFAAAFVAAFVWATYSVLSRQFASVPTDVVAAFCLATSVLAAVSHLAFEITVWPAGTGEWLAIVGLG